MSRPFSYNDDNFTVIGNVLYVHFKYDDAAEAGTRLCEIPPAIYDRLLFYTNVGASCYPVDGYAAGTVPLSAIKYENKFYLTNAVKISAYNNRYIYGTFILKDI